MRRAVIAIGFALAAVSCGAKPGGSPFAAAGSTSGSATSGAGGGSGASFIPPPIDDASLSFIPEAGGSGANTLGNSGSVVTPPNPVPQGCPLYTKLCGTTCVPITVDPNNCGDCGKTCAAPNDLCSAGTCVPASRGCIPAPQGGDPALTACNHACVDTLNDDNNCGPPMGTVACGHKCASTEGCVDGACVPKFAGITATAPASCNECFRDIAVATFRWALCSCGNVNLQQQLVTDGYDSTQGPYPPTPLQLGGGVGTNGDFVGGGAAVNVGGALWCSGPAGATTTANATVSQEAHVGNALNAAGGTLGLLDSAWVGGKVSGNVNISKTLYVSPNATVAAGVKAMATIKQPVTVAPPCDCSDTALLGQSIAQIVATHATSNDNAIVGLNAAALATPSATAIRLDLPCGRYYLSGVNQPGTSVTIFAHGRTSLFIEGDVVGATVSFVLDPTAEFDTFVTGTVRVSGQFIVGSPNYPALSRTYIGGSAPIDLSGEAGRTAGNLYFGKAPLNVSSHLVVYGGLIAASIANQENIEIHYDRAVLSVPACVKPTPPMCQSCRECGNNPCLNGKCSATCSSSSECCAPLQCLSGKCGLVPPPPPR